MRVVAYVVAWYVGEVIGFVVWAACQVCPPLKRRVEAWMAVPR